MTTRYIKLHDRIDTARALSRKDHSDKEVLKRGVLRAGSSGIMDADGAIAGACHRVSLLRSKGIEIDPPTEDKHIMFELGYANEDEIVKQLKRTLQPGESLLVEEEIPVEWMTTNGTRVTGRPDIVMVENGKPVLGLELKSVHSVWVAREVLFGGKPKLNNLVQAAHYMWQLGEIPYKLFYKSYSQLGQGAMGSDFVAKLFPSEGAPGSEYVDYTEVSPAQAAKGKTPNVKHVKQFEVIYDIRFDKSGRLEFRNEKYQDGPWESTIVTRQDIHRYFEYVSQMEKKKDLGPVPSSVDAVGNKLNYQVCKYCKLKDVCSKPKPYDQWMQEVTALVDSNKK